MIKYKTVKKATRVKHSIICDKCGKEFEYDSPEKQEFLQIQFQGGYFSAWGDGTVVSCDLCSACSKEVLEPFARTFGFWDSIAELPTK